MPVRVRCPQCEKVVNAPDAARGKAVKCPECQARISVPASDEESSGKGKASKSPAKPAAKAAPAKKKAAESEDFLAKLDLSRSEDRNTRVCPKCGTVVNEEDEECMVCGVDLQTGSLGKTARKARMKWADPNDFYGLAWKDATAFVRENFALTLKTWGNVVFLMVCSAAAGGLAGLFASFDHTPSMAFFGVLAALASLGVYGWFFSLSTKVIQFTLDKKIVLDRTSFEIFSAMATGISYVVWFVASAVPFSIIIFPVYLFTRDSGQAVNYGVTAAVALFFVGLPLPCVMAHRAMPVNWMIWVSPLMWKIAAKTAGGVLYTWLIAFVTFLPVALSIAGEVLLAKNYLIGTMGALGIKNTSAIASATAKNGFPFSESSVGTVAAVFLLLAMLLLRALTTFTFTVWAMYMLRVVAQFTFYNKRNLELIGQIKEKKYVAREIEVDEHGDPIHRGSTAVKVGGGVFIFLILFVAVNAILFMTTGRLLLPRPIAVLLRLVN